MPRLEDEHIIDTTWIFRNKTDKKGNVILNKACLVAQGYSQMEGVDYDEIFALVACVESIRDRKSTRLNSSHRIASRMPSSA